MKVAIFGNGYIGKNLQYALDMYYNIDADIIARKDVDYSHSINGYRDVLEYIGDTKYSAIINCSGYTGNPNVDAAETDKDNCRAMNVGVTLNLKNVADGLNIPYFHISSGCIYNGYRKLWTEDDEPNFGYLNPESSYYSKTKHRAEVYLNNCYIIRPRMPFGSFFDELNPKDYIQKLVRYDNIVDTLNSKTYIPDMCNFICHLILTSNGKKPTEKHIYNYTQTEPLDVKSVIRITKEYGLFNPNWKIVDWEDLNIVANRSNCLLSMHKILNMGEVILTEEECLRTYLHSGQKAKLW